MRDLHARTPVERILKPLGEFAAIEASGGIVLLACTAIALAWANSPWGGGYVALWQTPLGFKLGGFALTKPLLLWINDGLMAVFFFVVGLEIKREILAGELSRPRQAALPIAGAIGGMAVPALLYLLLNHGGDAARGWGVPMATDIAFAIGVMALLGDRVPAALKVFLTALAIVDDLGAVLVIAFFYTAQLHWANLAMAAVLLALLLLANRAGVRAPAVYAVLGIAVWFLFLKSGVHATVAGVLVAMTVPARTRIDREGFLAVARGQVDAFAGAGPSARPGFAGPGQLDALSALEHACERAGTPLQRLEHVLHPWVGFVIMPVFALANAGVRVVGEDEPLGAPFVVLGIVLGLVVGKPLGISLISWLAVRLGLAERPPGTDWGQLVGVACLGGIGFTMALFIASLAFEGTLLLPSAKIGVLVASVIAALLGWAALTAAGRRRA